MQKHEFEELIGREISDRDYKTVEFVYQFHPAVSEVSGKEEVAELYKSFGMVIFHDMKPRADANRILETELLAARAKANRIREQMEELRECELPEDALLPFRKEKEPSAQG